MYVLCIIDTTFMTLCERFLMFLVIPDECKTELKGRITFNRKTNIVIKSH